MTPAAGDFEIPAVYLNVVATGAAGTGYLSVYRPPTYPGTSTVNFGAGQTIANLAIVATAIVLGRYAVRIRASSPVHVVADLTGFTVKGDVATPEAAQKKSPGAQRERTTQQRAAVVSRLRSTLTERIRSGLAR